MFIPPGGMAGFVQMTPASRVALTRGAANRPATGTRRRRRKARAKTARKASARRSNGRKLKFGSPAWRKKYNLGKKKRG